MLAVDGRAEPSVPGIGPVTCGAVVGVGWLSGTPGGVGGAERQAAIAAAIEAINPVRNQRLEVGFEGRGGFMQGSRAE